MQATGAFIRTATLIAVMVMSLAWAPAALAQAPSPQPARDRIVRPGDATISGRIIEAGSNQPVRNARVHAASPALPGGRNVYTGIDGVTTPRAVAGPYFAY